MEEKRLARDDETVPIVAPLKVLLQKTINKRFGWWSAVVLLESYGRKQVCFYLWQKKDGGGWKRKQKFAVHNQEDWELIQEAVEGMIGQLT
ncbi:MAG: hypothetical protein ABIJ27_06285 [Candidatus Omnitrophota bacterium]